MLSFGNKEENMKFLIDNYKIIINEVNGVIDYSYLKNDIVDNIIKIVEVDEFIYYFINEMKKYEGMDFMIRKLERVYEENPNLVLSKFKPILIWKKDI